MTKAKAQLQALGRSAKRAHERTKEGRTEFIAGTSELAAAFCRARSKLPSDQAFRAWIEQAGLRSIGKDDRRALIFIGRHVTAARRFFMQNEDRWSWRMCAFHCRCSSRFRSLRSRSSVRRERSLCRSLRKFIPLNAPYQVVTSDPKPLAAPLKLVTSERDQRECMPQPKQARHSGYMKRPGRCEQLSRPHRCRRLPSRFTGHSSEVSDLHQTEYGKRRIGSNCWQMPWNRRLCVSHNITNADRKVRGYDYPDGPNGEVSERP